MENIQPEQSRLLNRLREEAPGVVVEWSEERGAASLLEGALAPWPVLGEPAQILPAILQRFGPLLGPPAAALRHVVSGVHRNQDGGYRARAFQVYEWERLPGRLLPIYGAVLLAFADPERGVYRVQSGFWREVQVTGDLSLHEPQVRERLTQRLRGDPGTGQFEARWRDGESPGDWETENFPLLAPPALNLVRVEGGFHPAYDILAYLPTEWHGVDGMRRSRIDRVNLMLDASTGEVIWEQPLIQGAFNDRNGDGLSTLRDASNNPFTRGLQVVQQDTADYYLLNRDHAPHIRTYDAGGSETNLVSKLKGDADLSKDADSHWNTATTSTSSATRAAAQQPEVDAHFFAEEAYNFYHNLGWDGFDDGGWGTHCLVRQAAHIGMDNNAYSHYYTVYDSAQQKLTYHGYLAFYDGFAVGNNLRWDFMVGDPTLHAHEYQHSVTFFAVRKSNGDPGHMKASEWLLGINEGLSDAFAGLRTGRWTMPVFAPNGVLHTGQNFASTDEHGNPCTLRCQPFRRIEYPRSTDTYFGDWYCDHYDDATTVQTTPYFTRKYFVSGLISHLAYLVGQGGVHQRQSRAAQLIPVAGVGQQLTAKIFFYALANYFDDLPSNKEGPTMIKAGKHLLSAAEHESGSKRSCAYVMMRRALHAVGMYPFDEAGLNRQTYGGEACMLPWTFSWRLSQPYIGMPALWWQSPDLFINNGGAATHEAVIDQENHLFARVRNVGDQAINNVRVRFSFRRMGTNLPTSQAGWEVCRDQAGNDCILDIASIPAGGSNVADPNNPPAGQAVHWYLNRAFVTQDVQHFCLRATVECTAANNDNDCPNQVQSNIRHVEPPAGAATDLAFEVNNWLDALVPLDVRVEHTLPRGYQVQYVGATPLSQINLAYGQAMALHYRLDTPANASVEVQAPYEGHVAGRVIGRVSGELEGELGRLTVDERAVVGAGLVPLEGLLAGEVAAAHRRRIALSGRFAGELDLSDCRLRGEFVGGVSVPGRDFAPEERLQLEAVLTPRRAIHFTQYVKGEPVGGVTVMVETPRPPMP